MFRFVSIGAILFSIWASAERLDADLLVVGGTESGCAAAVQAARMGVGSIVLVNDIAWLGGQFSAEGLCAIDESIDTQGTGMGIRHGHPIPRNGLFKEVVDRIEAHNVAAYGLASPGNTRVNTTCRPADAERVFRELLEPYVARGQVRIVSGYYPVEVTVTDGAVTAVRFQSTGEDNGTVTVHARLTIDASDWGDVIRLSGAAYAFGPDLKSVYGEPEAPESRDAYPLTDMNPITYTAIIEETDDDAAIPEPAGYDASAFNRTPYPKNHAFFYESRRLIDHYGNEGVDSPDVILLCHPNQDYPLDVYPAAVAAALDAMEPGASKKNIVEMGRELRQIVFADAKNRTLQQLYWLQNDLPENEDEKAHSFRRFRLTPEFGTPDDLPPKPYVRESLRMEAMYMMKQQDTMGAGGVSQHFAAEMYYDGVACWQFEYDYHPTRRAFLDDDPAGPWMAQFRPLRNWGPPYSGRATVPIRSFVPVETDGLLAAQKNLGFSSIVSSAVRLHDHSMAVGQAAGAIAAVALGQETQPRRIPADPRLIEAVRRGLCTSHDGGIPAAVWPFRDIAPDHPAFAAIQLLAARRAFPLTAAGENFGADAPADPSWREAVVARTAETTAGALPAAPTEAMSRGEFAQAWYTLIAELREEPFDRQSETDADGDGLPDRSDPMPYGHDIRLPVAPAPAGGVS